MTTPMSLRKSMRAYTSHLNREQRRQWLIQRLRLTPKVNISGSYLPPSVARQYVQIEWLRGAA
jgi:hypothetical protein